MKLSLPKTCFLAGLTILLSQRAAGSAEPPEPRLKQVPLLDFRQKGGRAVSFCSTSQNIFIAFAAEGSRKVHRWDVRSGRAVRAYSAPRGYRCDYTTPSPDGKLLLVATYDLVHDALNKVFKVLLVDTETGAVIKVLEYRDYITYVQFSRDGQTFRLSPGLPSSYPEWVGAIFDRNGKPAVKPDTKAFDPPESAILAQGEWKDEYLYYFSGGRRTKLVKGAFEYFPAAGDTLLASSTSSGEVVIWRVNDLKELYRSSFGRHPIWLRFDERMNRFLVINGNEAENSKLVGIQIEPAR
jgi:hypothetical protein